MSDIWLCCQQDDDPNRGSAGTYFHPLHYFVQTHALEPPEVDEVMNLFQETRLVLLLGRAVTPEFIWNNL